MALGNYFFCFCYFKTTVTTCFVTVKSLGLPCKSLTVNDVLSLELKPLNSH